MRVRGKGGGAREVYDQAVRVCVVEGTGEFNVRFRVRVRGRGRVRVKGRGRVSVRAIVRVRARFRVTSSVQSTRWFWGQV